MQVFQLIIQLEYIFMGKVRIAELLIQKGADVSARGNPYNSTAFHGLVHVFQDEGNCE